MTKVPTSTDHQQGLALFVSLVFLVILTLLGLTAMTTTSLEAMMASGDQDRNLALEAAEAALRQGQTLAAQGPTGFNATCSGGLCLPSSTVNAVWSWTGGAANWGAGAGVSNVVVPFPAGTVSVDPEFILEPLPRVITPGSSQNTGQGLSGVAAYRITAVGWGARASTHVMLQSVYIQ